MVENVNEQNTKGKEDFCSQGVQGAEHNFFFTTLHSQLFVWPVLWPFHSTLLYKKELNWFLDLNKSFGCLYCCLI